MTIHRTLLIMAAAAVAALFSQCAQAQVFGLHLHSLHVPAKEQDNNLNLGAYVRTESGLTMGFYRNTLRRNSFYVGQSFALIGPVDVTVGAITGYKIKDGQGWSRNYLGPLVALSVASPVQVMGLTLRLTLVPGHLVKSRTVLHLSVETRF